MGQKEISPNSYQFVGLKDVWEYNPIANTWTASEDYPGDAFIDQINGSSGDRVCVGTGETGKDIYYGRDFWVIK